MSHLDAITVAPYTMELARGVLAGDRLSLSKAITLVESTRADHRAQADLLSDYLAAQSPSQPPLVYRGQPHSMRLGVAGPPGAGKSTFIERLGLTLLARDAAVKVAVVPVDPSSHIGGGSILGDKVRFACGRAGSTHSPFVTDRHAPCTDAHGAPEPRRPRVHTR